MPRYFRKSPLVQGISFPVNIITKLTSVCKGDRNVLQKLFFASGVLLANFNFSSPRIPKIASILYFWVFVVKEKLKLSQNYLLGFHARFGFILFRQRKIKNHLKFSARCDIMFIRYGFTL